MKVVSMMSGTSGDGVDLVCCLFKRESNSRIAYKVVAAETHPYDKQHLQLIQEMQDSHTTYLQFRQLEIRYSARVVEMVLAFLVKSQIDLASIDLVALHGHTIYHQPEFALTVQALNLCYVAAKLQKNVIGNFREMDVMRGKQGAPLVPYGQQLFQGEVFVNLGGIANLGHKGRGNDLHFCNLFANCIAKIFCQLDYDKDGEIGRKGHLDETVIQYLNWYGLGSEKVSLSREIFQPFMDQFLERFGQLSAEIILRSFYQFLARKIVDCIEEETERCQTEVVCTGGGANNKYLIELLNQKSVFKGSGCNFVVPEPELVNFKQAIVFGYLGVKYLLDGRNCETGTGGYLCKGEAGRQFSLD